MRVCTFNFPLEFKDKTSVLCIYLLMYVFLFV